MCMRTVRLATLAAVWASAIAGCSSGPVPPALTATIDVGDPPYSAQVAAVSPAPIAPGDRVDTTVTANGQRMTVVVKAPITTHTYHVPPIGAGQDPVAYFAGALAAAGNQATIVFPPGVAYQFGAIDCVDGADPMYTPAYVQVTGLSDVVIDGNGSTLNLTSPCQAIAVNDVQRVVLENFTVDWPDLAIAGVGVITATGGNGTDGFTFDVQLDPAAVAAGAGQTIAAVTAWDAVNGYWSLDRPLDDVSYGGVASPTLSSGGAASGVPSFGVSFPVGEHVLLRYAVGSSPAIVLGTAGEADDVTFHGVTLSSSPQGGFFLQHGRGLRIDDCTVTRSNGRPISLVADAVHVDGAVGGDVIVENSTFAYQGDDGFNLNMPITAVAAGAGSTQLKLPDFASPQVGDPLALFDGELGFVVPPATLTVQSVTDNHDGTDTVTLGAGVPARAAGGYVADLAGPSARYILRNNQYLHNRARGVLLQTAYGLVEHNTFVGQTLMAIYVVSSTFWGEGAGAQNLLLLDNDVSQTGHGGGLAAVVVTREDSQATPVYMPASGSTPVPPIPAIHQNLILAGNRIHDTPGAGVYLSSANAVAVYRNQLSNTVQAPMANTINGAPTIAAPIVVNDASNVVLQSNVVSGGPADPVAIDATTTRGITVMP